MGVESSTELPKPVQDVMEWPSGRVESVIKAYHEGEYDFAIDHTIVMNITGYDADEAREMVQLHTKTESGMINAITFLITLISLGNNGNRNEVGRLSAIFDLMDFSNKGQISMDELTIMFLCIGSSYTFILSRQTEEPIDGAIIKYAKDLYEQLGKKNNSAITKNELVEYVKEKVFGQGINNIPDILNVLTNTGTEENKDVEK